MGPSYKLVKIPCSGANPVNVGLKHQVLWPFKLGGMHGEGKAEELKHGFFYPKADATTSTVKSTENEPDSNGVPQTTAAVVVSLGGVVISGQNVGGEDLSLQANLQPS